MSNLLASEPVSQLNPFTRSLAHRLTKQGFTLVELLISVAIVAFAGLAIYSVLNNGIIAWRRGSRNRSFERSIRLTSEKISREIRNTFKFSTIPFEGAEDFVKFPALITVECGPEHYQFGRAAYFYDSKQDSLSKEEKTYPGLFEDEGITAGRVLLKGVKEVEFSYCYLDNATGDYKWKDDWKKEEQDSIPRAIRIRVAFKKKTNQKDFEQTIFIPIGTGEQKIELK
ncbi:MAG: prepilin-type N-terminal cleavage/methylation domain-containing protein [Candidatus Omnitrophota bacterium]|nr:prepilin-type N-terminal cleavage/methylation domain-containing protein [Candidatus Omnitrophota bacterium]